MELHQLRYFVAVAQTGNFSRAAEQCFVSQPSLSQQVRKLETGLGQNLFNRLGRRAVLTDAGRLLLERALAILSAVDDTKHRLKDFDHLQGGRLVVGAIPTIAPYVLPGALRGFLKRHPHVEVTVHEDLTQHVVQATAAGELDLALVALPITDERLTVEPLFSEPLLLALPPRHRLTRQRKITMEDVRPERFILLNEMHCLGGQVLSFCRDQACQRIACWSSQLATVQTLIAMGQGVSLLPAMAQQAEGSLRLTYRKLSDECPVRTVAAIWHRQRYHSLAAERFLVGLREMKGNGRRE
jgi:LysR family transcriptional regulator, hydrogen peroxide-inducible genes activator